MEIKKEFASVGNLNGFYQEYMNIAQSPDDAPFKPDYIHLHHYDFEKINSQPCLVREVGDEKKIIPVELYTGVDPASSLSARADYFVIATIAIHCCFIFLPLVHHITCRQAFFTLCNTTPRS